jgi:hypothetical protein
VLEVRNQSHLLVQLISYLEWLRSFRTDVDPPSPYKAAGKVMALSVHYASRSNDSFYGQWLVANVPFRSGAALQCVQAKRVPSSHKWFTTCVTLCPSYWRNFAAIERDVRMECGIKATQTLMYMYRSWVTFVDLFLMHGWEIPVANNLIQCELELTDEQHGILRDLQLAGQLRRTQEGEGSVGMQRWAVCGDAGTGKSAVLDTYVVSERRENDRILLTSPTGVLSDVYRQRYLQDGDITVDTFDGGFRFGKDPQLTAWRLASYKKNIFAGEWPQLSAARRTGRRPGRRASRRTGRRAARQASRQAGRQAGRRQAASLAGSLGTGLGAGLAAGLAAGLVAGLAAGLAAGQAVELTAAECLSGPHLGPPPGSAS